MRVVHYVDESFFQTQGAKVVSTPGALIRLVVSTPGALIRLTHSRGGEINCEDSGAGHTAEVSGGPVVRGMHAEAPQGKGLNLFKLASPA